MSVPKSNVLSCSRSFLAKTDLGYCSPKQSQNVNVVVSPQMCHYDATPNPYDVQAGEEELRLNEVPYYILATFFSLTYINFIFV